jgi:histidinol-phosphate phosphatase family protein
MSNVDSINNFIVDSFAKQNIVIDFVKVCPHTPEDGCKCRKPKVGLLDKEISSGGIDLGNSYLVGDQESDVLFGNRLGMTTIRLMEHALDGTSADFVVKSLGEIPGILDVK